MVVSSSVHSRLLGSLNSQCANSSSSCSFSPLCRHLSGAKALKTSHNFGIELHLKNVVRGASSFFFPAPFLRAPGQLLRRSQISLKNGVVCTAMDSSFGGSEPAQPIFPRIDVRDPYKRLGVSREASEEEIREAHNYLSNLVPFSLFSLLHLISSISKKSCNSGHFVFKITSGLGFWPLFQHCLNLRVC
jgi:hypothetical protein